jgi:uncharacterized protein (TIRG00374 family)
MILWVGPQRIAQLAARSNPLWLPVAFLLYLGFLLLRGVRWAWLLKPLGKVTYRNTVGITILGWFFNAFIPLRAGEFPRAYLLSRREEVGVVEGVSTIAVERVLDLLAVATIGLVSLRFVPGTAHVDGNILAALRIAWVIPTILVAMVVAGLCFEERILGIAARTTVILPRRWRAKAVETLRSLIRGSRGLRGRPPEVAALMGLSFGLWFVSLGMYLAFYEAMVTGPLDLRLLIPAFAIFLLTFTITILPANVGTYEGFFVAIFVGLGLGLSSAVILAFALMTHIFSLLSMGIIGSASMVWYGASAKGVPWKAAAVGATAPEEARPEPSTDGKVL